MNETMSTVERIREYAALGIALTFVGIREIVKIAKRIRGVEEQPRPKAPIRKQNRLIAEIWG